MLIRPYLASDWQDVCRVHDLARRDELAAARLDAAFLTLEQTAHNEGFHDYTLRVAEIEGRVVAFVAFTQDELAWLYVHPDGYRKGIGTALIHAALAETRRPMHVELLEGNTAALELYRKAGFAPISVEHGRMPGNEGFAVTVAVLRHPGVA